jgi:hypothetical protein
MKEPRDMRPGASASASTRQTWSNEHASRATAASPSPPAPRSSGFLLFNLLLVFSRFLVRLLVLSGFFVRLLLVFGGFLVRLLLVFSRFLGASLLLVLSGLLGRDFPCTDHLSEGVQLFSGARASTCERRQQAAQKPRPIGRDQDPVDLNNKAEQVESYSLRNVEDYAIFLHFDLLLICTYLHDCIGSPDTHESRAQTTQRAVAFLLSRGGLIAVGGSALLVLWAVAK